MLRLKLRRKEYRMDIWQKKEPTGHSVDLRQVVKIYQSAAGTFTALNGIDLQVETGEFIAFIGKSGSGKSTLINVIAGK